MKRNLKQYVLLKLLGSVKCFSNIVTTKDLTVVSRDIKIGKLVNMPKSSEFE